MTIGTVAFFRIADGCTSLPQNIREAAGPAKQQQ